MKYNAYCQNYEIISWTHDPINVELGDLTQVNRNTRGKCLESIDAGGRCIYNCNDIVVHGMATVVGSSEEGNTISLSIGPCDAEGFSRVPVRKIYTRGEIQILG